MGATNLLDCAEFWLRWSAMQQQSPSLFQRSAASTAEKERFPSAEAPDGDDSAPAVRGRWSHAVASALQPVVGEILDVDGATFAEPFKRLARRMPSPANVPSAVI